MGNRNLASVCAYHLQDFSSSCDVSRFIEKMEELCDATSTEEQDNIQFHIHGSRLGAKGFQRLNDLMDERGIYPEVVLYNVHPAHQPSYKYYADSIPVSFEQGVAPKNSIDISALYGGYGSVSYFSYDAPIDYVAEARAGTLEQTLQDRINNDPRVAEIRQKMERECARLNASQEKLEILSPAEQAKFDRMESQYEKVAALRKMVATHVD